VMSSPFFLMRDTFQRFSTTLTMEPNLAGDSVESRLDLPREHVHDMFSLEEDDRERASHCHSAARPV
jgi:hypothetical protein